MPISFNSSGPNFRAPPIDWSVLGDIGSNIASGLSQAAIANALKDFNGDYNAAAAKLLSLGYVNEATKLYAAGTAGRETFGLTPLFDQSGNAYQPSNRGGVRPITLPNGEQPQDTVHYVNTPQGAFPRRLHGGMAPTTDANGIPVTAPTADTGNGAPPSSDFGMEPPPADYGVGQPIPKDYSTPAEQKTTGETAGKAKDALPNTEAMVNRTVGLLNSIENDPHLTDAIGPINSRLPTLKGTTGDVESKIQQGVGNVFTSAYESLRGAQAITDIEGEKATAAIARVENLKQSDKGYKESLNDAKYEVFNLLNIVRRKAGLPEVPNPFAKKDQSRVVAPQSPPIQTAPPGAIRVPTYNVSPGGQVTPNGLNVPSVPGAINGPVTRDSNPYDPVTARLSELISSGRVSPQRVEAAMRSDGYSEAEIQRVLGKTR